MVQPSLNSPLLRDGVASLNTEGGFDGVVFTGVMDIGVHLLLLGLLGLRGSKS